MAPDNLLQHMYAKGLVTPEEYEEINACTTTRMKNIKILDCLPKKDPAKVDVFLECLRGTGQEYVAEHLLKSLKPLHVASERKSSTGEGGSSGTPTEKEDSPRKTEGNSHRQVTKQQKPVFSISIIITPSVHVVHDNNNSNRHEC